MNSNTYWSLTFKIMSVEAPSEREREREREREKHRDEGVPSALRVEDASRHTERWDL
jgi:hypothetical protein